MVTAVSRIFADAATPIGDYAPYGIVGAGLVLLFRMVFRTMSVKDKEVWTLVRQMQSERDRANEWAQYHARVAAYWQARALGDPNPPRHPREPDTLPPPSVNIDPIPPPQ